MIGRRSRRLSTVPHRSGPAPVSTHYLQPGGTDRNDPYTYYRVVNIASLCSLESPVPPPLIRSSHIILITAMARTAIRFKRPGEFNTSSEVYTSWDYHSNIEYLRLEQDQTRKIGRPPAVLIPGTTVKVGSWEAATPAWEVCYYSAHGKSITASISFHSTYTIDVMRGAD